MPLINLKTTLDSQYTLNRDTDNNVTSIDIVLNENFTTIDFDVAGPVDIVLNVNGILGSGNITYQKSIDRVTWFNELNDAQDGDFRLALTTEGIYNILDKRAFTGWRKLVWTLTSVLGGDVSIKVQNGY